MHKIAFVVAALVASSASAQALKTEDEKSLYAIGARLGSQLKALNLSPHEAEIVKRGFSDSATGKKEQVEFDEERSKQVRALFEKRSAAASDKAKTSGRAYVEQAAKQPGAVKLPSGVVYKQLKAGNGPSPQPTDRVKVNYEGKLTDGTVFDASSKHGGPAEFALNGVIRCWTEGVQKMKVGEKAQLVCPSDTAYGDHGNGTIPGGATLVFEVELLGVTPATPAAQPGGGTPPAPPTGKK